jgi:hypothetical protein
MIPKIHLFLMNNRPMKLKLSKNNLNPSQFKITQMTPNHLLINNLLKIILHNQSTVNNYLKSNQEKCFLLFNHS